MWESNAHAKRLMNNYTGKQAVINANQFLALEKNISTFLKIQFLNKFKADFAVKDKSLGRTSLVQHRMLLLCNTMLICHSP